MMSTAEPFRMTVARRRQQGEARAFRSEIGEQPPCAVGPDQRERDLRVQAADLGLFVYAEGAGFLHRISLSFQGLADSWCARAVECGFLA